MLQWVASLLPDISPVGTSTMPNRGETFLPDVERVGPDFRAPLELIFAGSYVEMFRV